MIRSTYNFFFFLKKAKNIDLKILISYANIKKMCQPSL